MSSNPYASPESDVSTHGSAEIQNTSIWNKRGRLSVASYWGQSLAIFVISAIVISIVAGIIAYMTGGFDSPGESFNPENFSPLVLIPVAILYLVMVWISFCQMIKRIHDINLNGWWVLTTFIGIGLILLFIPSKGEPNRFGGWRQTRMWEKVLAVLLLLGLILAVASPFIGAMLSGA